MGSPLRRRYSRWGLGVRAEAPGSLECRALLAIATKKQWSIGGLEVKTAFLHAPLGPEEDGVILLQPPSLLVKLG
eukprot:6978311-Prorocentrum_lima.AAC.1